MHRNFLFGDFVRRFCAAWILGGGSLKINSAKVQQKKCQKIVFSCEKSHFHSVLILFSVGECDSVAYIRKTLLDSWLCGILQFFFRQKVALNDRNLFLGDSFYQCINYVCNKALKTCSAFISSVLSGRRKPTSKNLASTFFQFIPQFL